MSWPSDGLPRFTVARGNGSEGGAYFYVLDRAYAHRVVARYASPGGGYPVARRRADAYALAAELEAKYGAA